MATRTAKAIIDFSSETESELLTKADLIIEGMTGNAHFPSPTPTLAAVQTARDNYKTSLMAAGTGNHAAVQAKMANRLALEDALNTLGNYVNTVARNNAEAIASGNFEVTKDPTPSYLGPVEMMKLTPGASSGTLVCKLSRVKNSKGYTFMITGDPITAESVWETYVTTRCMYEFTKLEPGRKYWVKVIISGTRGQSIQSGPISQYALE